MEAIAVIWWQYCRRRHKAKHTKIQLFCQRNCRERAQRRGKLYNVWKIIISSHSLI